MNSVQMYQQDEKRFMHLLQQYVPKFARYLAPDRPGLLFRCGFGVVPFNQLMELDIWSQDDEHYRVAAEIMNIYDKWVDKTMWHYDNE